MTDEATPGAAAPLSQRLIGSWELLSRIDRTSSGEHRTEPSLGADPIALLMYDSNGHFAAQFMKRDRRASLVEGTTAAAAANNSRAQGGYDAYFGTYSVDDGANTVTQTLTGALSQENVGQTLTRTMTVIGDELTIQLQTTAPSGEPVTRTLTWRRVA